MKLVFRIVLLAVAAIGLKADVLQLRDGSTFSGRYLGGTQTEIWFQRQGVASADAIPTSMVEAVKFGPLAGGLPTVPGQIDPVAAPAAALLVPSGGACRPAIPFRSAPVSSLVLKEI